MTLRQNQTVVKRSDGSELSLRPRFTVIYADTNPRKTYRYVDHGYVMRPHEREGLKYHVPVWGKPEDITIDPEPVIMISPFSR